MKRIGIVEFTTESLHETNDVFFNFIENNFKVLDIDHSNYETDGVIRMTLEDISDKFYFITPCCNEVYRYEIQTN
jgi:hypothetical protein